MNPDPASQALYHKLGQQFHVHHRPRLTVKKPESIKEPITLSEGAQAGPKLVLNRTGILHIEVEDGSASAWATDIVIPLAVTYNVPLPQAAAFGKVSFALTLADSGAITALTYGQVSGAAAPSNLAAAAAAAAKPPDAAERAAALKSEADEIAQTARVARCRASPADCI
jgi:hypothetical protein